MRAKGGGDSGWLRADMMVMVRIAKGGRPGAQLSVAPHPALMVYLQSQMYGSMSWAALGVPSRPERYQ